MKCSKKTTHVTERALDDARKCLGKGKYNDRTNFLVGDGYFALDCRARHGDEMWNEACKIVRKEK